MKSGLYCFIATLTLSACGKSEEKALEKSVDKLEKKINH